MSNTNQTLDDLLFGPSSTETTPLTSQLFSEEEEEENDVTNDNLEHQLFEDSDDEDDDEENEEEPLVELTKEESEELESQLFNDAPNTLNNTEPVEDYALMTIETTDYEESLDFIGSLVAGVSADGHKVDVSASFYTNGRLKTFAFNTIGA